MRHDFRIRRLKTKDIPIWNSCFCIQCGTICGTKKIFSLDILTWDVYTRRSKTNVNVPLMGAMQTRNRPHAFLMKHIMLIRLSTTSSAGLKQRKKKKLKESRGTRPHQMEFRKLLAILLNSLLDLYFREMSASTSDKELLLCSRVLIDSRKYIPC